MEMKKTGKEGAISLIRIKYLELCENGETRYPKKDDFSSEEVVMIKAFLGPWPRALEAAGIKPPREVDRVEKNREKRTRAKRMRRENENKGEN